MANCLREKYVWEVPVRVTHWVNLLAIIVLSVTGIYIGSPKTLAHNPTQYVMGWVRLVHFVAGYAFAISFAARLYWAFAGNRYANWREFLPFLNKAGRANMAGIFRYYTFRTRKVAHPIGHNALAGATYLLVFTLYLVVILTGFALYLEYAPHSLGHRLLGWMFRLFSDQGMRQTHHLGMWFLIAFAIHHVYSAWLMDIEERGGVMSSIFGGYKPVKEKE
jgi:Ni/Fe-hydrogenase 1 B-type cytochrome subunit